MTFRLLQDVVERAVF